MKLIGILLLALSFGQCASMKMENNHPFKIESATTESLPETNALNLAIEFTASKTIDFKKVYFQNRIADAVVEQKSNKKHIVAQYKTSLLEGKKDIILHADPKEEFGNTPNNPTEKFPFKLKENEAMVSYTIGDKIHYVKVENIVKKESI